LTGRENVYLNGAILGMRRDEIERKFDEIVAFAEIGKFIDTPVKHYSSGMYVRLAFAVAAHLEPEILIVDEVLAVGDAAFQDKCLSKMGEVSDAGRTVLFVSHNMAAIQSLCSHAYLIDHGNVVYDGSPESAVLRYLTMNVGRQKVEFGPDTSRRGTGRARYISATVLDSKGRPTSSIGIGEGFTVELKFVTDAVLSNPGFGVVIRNQLGNRIAQLITRITHGSMPRTEKGGIVRLHVERFDVLPGLYYLTLGMSLKGENLDFIENAMELEVISRDVYPGGKLPRPGSAIMFVPCHWSHDYA
jgi:lipopolysaccharide transport system ATP-binding protein